MAGENQEADDVTQILQAIRLGDLRASGELMPAIHAQLRTSLP